MPRRGTRKKGGMIRSVFGLTTPITRRAAHASASHMPSLPFGRSMSGVKEPSPKRSPRKTSPLRSSAPKARSAPKALILKNHENATIKKIAKEQRNQLLSKKRNTNAIIVNTHANTNAMTNANIYKLYRNTMLPTIRPIRPRKNFNKKKLTTTDIEIIQDNLNSEISVEGNRLPINLTGAKKTNQENAFKEIGEEVNNTTIEHVFESESKNSTHPPVQQTPISVSMIPTVATFIIRYTPYGRILFRRLQANVENSRRARTTSQTVAEYNSELDNGGLEEILQHCDINHLRQILKVFNPQILREFKSAMLSLYTKDPIAAKIIFELVLVQVVGNVNEVGESGPLIRRIISAMKENNPLGSVQDILDTIHNKLISSGLADELRSSRRFGNFTVSFLSSLVKKMLRLGLGAAAIWVLSYMNISSVDELRTEVSDIFHRPDGNMRSIGDIIQEVMNRVGILTYNTSTNASTSASASASTSTNTRTNARTNTRTNARTNANSDEKEEKVETVSSGTITTTWHFQDVVNGWYAYFKNYVMRLFGYDPTRFSNTTQFGRDFNKAFYDLFKWVSPWILSGTYNYMTRTSAASAASTASAAVSG